MKGDVSMGKNFIMIDNEILLNNEKFNIFSEIGTEGFTLYCYLLTQQSNKTYCQVNIKMIIDFFNRKTRNSKQLIDGNKQYKVSTMKNKRTIFRYLQKLKNNKFIEIDNLECKINKIFTIKIKKIESKNFTRISEELFVDYIYKIGHIGWSILYILTKLHNNDYGSISCEGFANPTEQYLSEIIKRNIKTIRMYLYLLQDYKLIKIENNDAIYKGINSKGIEIYEFLPNNYIVKNRVAENKYYIE